jgi:hypothetical protein
MRLVLFASPQDEQPWAEAMPMVRNGRPMFGRKQFSTDMPHNIAKRRHANF